MKRVLLSLCCLGCPLLGQNELTTIGRFVGTDGEPVADGEVTFATSPLGVYDAFAPVTLVSTRTDARGRFRVKLRAGTAYSAWAVGQATEAGRVRSGILEGVIAGSVLEIAATTAKDLPRLEVSEHDQLGDGGPFTALVRLDARHGPELSLPIAADGTVALPPLPDAVLCVRILAHDGKVRVASAGVIGQAIYFSPPREYRFVVRDEKGVPIEGAHVAFAATRYLGRGDEPFQAARVWHGLAEGTPTDAEGRTSLTVRDIGVILVAWAEDRALTISGVMNGDWVDNGEFAAEQPPFGKWPTEIEFTLQPADQLALRLHEGGTPVAGVGVRYVTELRVTQKNVAGSISASVDHTQELRTDAGGRVRINLPQVAGNMRLWIAPHAAGQPPTLVLPRSKAPAAPLDLDLARLPLATFQLLDAGGGPPQAGQVILLPGDVGRHPTDPAVLHADRAGRASARLEPGPWFVFATDGDGSSTMLLNARSGENERHELRLAPLARMTGRLIDAEGRPKAGARFQWMGTEGHGEPATPLERVLRHYSGTLTRGLTARTRTGEDGAFELRFLPVPGITHIGHVDALNSPNLRLREETDVELRLGQ